MMSQDEAWPLADTYRVERKGPLKSSGGERVSNT